MYALQARWKGSTLAVSGLGTMFAKVMMFGNVGWDSALRRAQQGAAEGEAGNVLQDIGVFNCFCSGFSPGEGGMAGDQNAGDGDGVKAFGAEALDNDGAG